MTRFIHLTDLHIAAPGTAAGAQKTDNLELLRTTVSHINAMPVLPDFVVASGDLTDLGDEESYRLFAELTAKLKPPLITALGNHDKRAGFHAVLGNKGSDAPWFHDAAHGDLHVITLDSSVPGHVAGAICEAQFGFLSHALTRHPDLPKLLVIHHPPRIDPAGLPWGTLDMNSTERLAAILSEHQVAGILSGHIHINRVMHWHGIPIFVSGGLDSSVDLLEPTDLRLVEGTSFGLCDWRPSGLNVSFVQLTPETREIGVVDRARLEAFA